MSAAATSPALRPYRGEADYDGIRTLLRAAFLANERRERSWHVARLDYWRWHVTAVVPGAPPFGTETFVWEAVDGSIVAALNPEGRREAHLQVHPDHATPDLEEAMIDIAEARLAGAGADGVRRLRIWCPADDAVRQGILRRRGFGPLGVPARQNRWSATGPIPDATVPEGCAVRPLGDATEHPARSWASWRAFHPDAPDADYEGHDWYAANIQRQPLYRGDLDLVAATADGTIAAFTTIWFDDVTRSAYFEPVGTAPEFQRRGLGKALLTEGLRRVRDLGAVSASVHGFTTAANGLYAAAGFTTFDRAEPWVREW